MRREIGEVIFLPTRQGRLAIAAGARVEVRERGTNTQLDVYATETGGGPLPQPLTADQFGRIEAWVAADSYDLHVDADDYQSYTQPVVSPLPAPGSNGEVLTWLGGRWQSAPGAGGESITGRTWWFNVKDYGTPSDDTGDARIGINAAIADARTTYLLTGRRQRVVLPRGTYRIPVDETPPSLLYPGWVGRWVHIGLLEGVELVGQGAVIHMPGQESFHVVIAPCSSFVDDAVMTGSNWAVRGITFDMGWPTARTDIEQNSEIINGGGPCEDWEVEDCTFINYRGDAVVNIASGVGQASRFEVKKCVFRNFAGQAVIVDKFAGVPRGADGLIEDCEAYEAPNAELFWMRGVDDVRFKGNRALDAGTVGANEADGVLFEDNIFGMIAGSQRSFGIGDTKNVTIRRNKLIGHGIDAAEGTTDGVLIEKNEFYGFDSWKHAAAFAYVGSTHKNWRLTKNDFYDSAPGTLIAFIPGVVGLHIEDNVVYSGEGRNIIYANGGDAQIHKNRIYGEGAILAGARSSVDNNFIEMGPTGTRGAASGEAGDLGFVGANGPALALGADSTASGNQVASDWATAIEVYGSRVLVARNIIETLDPATNYVRSSTGVYTDVKVLDNVEVPTAGPGGSTPVAGYDLPQTAGSVVRQTVPRGTFANLVLAHAALSSYWRLGELMGKVARDSKGPKHLNYAGGYTYGQTGLQTSDSDKAVALDGSTGKVVAPNEAPGLTGDWTLAALIRPTDVVGVQGIAGNGENGGAFNATHLIYLDGAAAAVLYGSSAGYTIATGGVIAAGLPSLVVGTYVDATKTLTLYVNGVQVAQTVGATEPPDGANTTFCIGANNGGATGFFEGVVDEVALYSAALSAAEIAALDAEV